MILRRRRAVGEKGSALAIAIIVLFVLGVLGMALMLSSATESDISTNYRWSEMAFYNADAGLEYGKNVLAGYMLRDGDFGAALPPARIAGEMWGPPTDAACDAQVDPGCRDYQFRVDHADHALFIGRVLRDLNGRPLQFDFRSPVNGDLRGDLDGDGLQDIQGTVTIWVRRPVTAGTDYTENDRAIITAEGTAPNYQAAASGRPAALRRLEMVIAVGAGVAASNLLYTDTTSGGMSDGSKAGSGNAKLNVN